MSKFRTLASRFHDIAMEASAYATDASTRGEHLAAQTFYEVASGGHQWADWLLTHSQADHHRPDPAIAIGAKHAAKDGA